MSAPYGPLAQLQQLDGDEYDAYGYDGEDPLDLYFQDGDGPDYDDDDDDGADRLPQPTASPHGQGFPAAAAAADAGGRGVDRSGGGYAVYGSRDGSVFVGQEGRPRPEGAQGLGLTGCSEGSA